MKTGILVSIQENGIHGTPAYSKPVYFAKNEDDADNYMISHDIRRGQYYHCEAIHFEFSSEEG